MGRQAVLHIPLHLRRDFDRRPPSQFYKRLSNALIERDYSVSLDPYERRGWQRIDPDDGRLHFVNNGNLQQRNVLNTAIAHLDHFWQVDPKGVLCDSSIKDEVFDPTSIDKKAAWAFFQRLRKDYAFARKSRYGQPKDVAEVPRGVIAVFLQGASHITDRARKFSTPDMIRSVAKGAGDRPILVKPHPLKVADEDLKAVADLKASGVNIDISEANVHDLLAAAFVTVSISSACSFEGFLHKTPAVLYGHSDFHHFAESLGDLDGFEDAMARARARRGGYSGYVYWFLRNHCVWTRERNFWAKIDARIEALDLDGDSARADSSAQAASG